MRRQFGQTSRETPAALRVARMHLPLLIFFGLAAAGMLVVYWQFSPSAESAAAYLATSPESIVDDPGTLVQTIHKSVPALPVTQRVAQSPRPTLVGLIAGHRGFDSGAACDDGLTEVQINESVTERVASQLREAGFATETMDEFDPRLNGYSATALVSIHADSCDYINELATGFKISGSSLTDSSALSICLEDKYGQATGLPYHPNSITEHMANYHAFREISPGTPAVIIEIGFLHLDRASLTSGSESVVDGITEGIRCFLEQSE